MPSSHFYRVFFLRCCLAVALFCCLASPVTAEEDAHKGGLFLVATEQLDGTSFHHTVILITHFSPHGAVGLAINRPSSVPLHEVFPQIGPLRPSVDLLYLGGPVSANDIFILARTLRPLEGMQHIAADVYFATGQVAQDYPIDNATRIYAGYTGWAPGQLQAEIERGDWMVIEDDANLVFEENAANLWQRLYQSWSGEWI